VAGNSYAVEKKDKDKKVEVKKTTKTKPGKAVQKPALTKPGDTSRILPKVSAAGRKYDRFVDKNKNGIDDRKEKLVPKTKPATKTAVKKPTATKSKKK
jgi:hypothetical protein